MILVAPEFKKLEQLFMLLPDYEVLKECNSPRVK